MFIFFLFFSSYQPIVQVCAFLKDKVKPKLSALPNKLKIHIKDLNQGEIETVIQSS